MGSNSNSIGHFLFYFARRFITEARATLASRGGAVAAATQSQRLLPAFPSSLLFLSMHGGRERESPRFRVSFIPQPVFTTFLVFSPPSVDRFSQLARALRNDFRPMLDRTHELRPFNRSNHLVLLPFILFSLPPIVMFSLL